MQQASTAFSQGNLESAERLCRAGLGQNPRDPDLLHLRGLVAKERGLMLRSLECFDASLKVSGKQPVVWSNKANLLRTLGQIEESDRCYDKATRLLPSFRDAWHNRGALELERDNPAKAIRWFEKAQRVETTISTTTSLVEAHLSLEEYAKAAKLLNKTKKKWPEDLSILVGEVRLLVAQREYAKALSILERALSNHPNKGFVCYQLGLVYLDHLKITEATEWLESALEISPDLIDAHRVLNSLYRESDDPRFLLSYAEAISKLPQHAPLYHNLSAAYLSVGEVEAAGECLSKAIDEIGRNPYLVHAFGVFGLRSGNYAQARPLLVEAVSRLPDNVRFLIDLANLNLREENYIEVEKQLDHSQRVEPYNQEIWAYYSLLWRQTNPDKYRWLNQHDRFIQQHELEFTGETTEYMSELKSYLLGLHSGTKEPLDQSVRNGTQSLDNLWRHKHPAIEQLRTSLNESIKSYIRSLDTDDTHPFLKRIKKSYRVSGCWSVKLDNGGFHANHVHSKGWLSCCTYVALPEPVHQSDATQDGWIKFGESSIGLGQRETISRTIKPKEGTCVFFPSFFWHGTNSFSAVEPRLTIPLDIEPID